MKNIYRTIIIMLTLSACTVREAAVIGAIPGRMVGLPIGMAMTAVDESFKTATDVVKANPRYQPLNKHRYANSNMHYHSRPPVRSIYSANDNSHYYKAEILIKTQGRANIQSMYLLESEDVTNFWQ